VFAQNEKEKIQQNVEQIFEHMGLTSADRSNKATLLLTVPCSFQVVCKGFIPAYIVLQSTNKQVGISAK
jgi:hypothetical protein